MAQFLTVSQARAFEIGGREFDIISLIDNGRPDGWITPGSVNELEVGQIAYVHALGNWRRGVVAKLGRTKAVVVFTTQGALDDAIRHGRGGASVRVADTAVQLSQIKIPAAPVDEPAEDPRQWATENTEYPAPKPAEETSPEDLTLNSQDCKVSPDSKDEPEGDEMSTETTTQTETPATENTDAPARPMPADMTGSAVVTLMEQVWERIRQNHPELPAVIIVTGTGMIGPSRWGHFRANGWMARAEGEDAATDLALGEMFMAGETMAKGARQVVQTMLHEAAHVLAQVRNLKDTSRQGRWHNGTFRKLAEEMGLEHKAATAHTQHGFSFVTLTEETEAKYADLLGELDREIRLVVDLPWFLKGTEKPAGEQGEDESEGGEFIHGGRRKATTTTPQSGNLKATCGCAEPNIIRASRKVLDLEVIRCDECEELFTAE